MIRRVASALLVGGLLQAGALGQAPPQIARPDSPPAPNPPAAATPAPAPAARGYREPLPTDPAHPQYHAAAHRSILRHNPLPRRTSYQSNYPYGGSLGGGSPGGNNAAGAVARAGFSDGGVGRVAEYYDEHTLDAPVNYHPNPTGRFDSGGGPDRAEQIAAQQAGTQRAQLTQETINTFGRPYGAYGAGLGFGLGLSGGMLYNYPY